MSGDIEAVRVKCLDHVTIIVKDLERSRQFYVDALGMRSVERPGFSFPGTWFQAGTTQIHLILEHDGSGSAGRSFPSEAPSSRTHHFAFEVDDPYAAARKFEEIGVPIARGPVERPDGAVQVFVTDPDGHVVELCSPPPRV